MISCSGDQSFNHQMGSSVEHSSVGASHHASDAFGQLIQGSPDPVAGPAEALTMPKATSEITPEITPPPSAGAESSCACTCPSHANGGSSSGAADSGGTPSLEDSIDWLFDNFDSLTDEGSNSVSFGKLEELAQNGTPEQQMHSKNLLGSKQVLEALDKPKGSSSGDQKIGRTNSADRKARAMSAINGGPPSDAPSAGKEPDSGTEKPGSGKEPDSGSEKPGSGGDKPDAPGSGTGSVPPPSGGEGGGAPPVSVPPGSGASSQSFMLPEKLASGLSASGVPGGIPVGGKPMATIDPSSIKNASDASPSIQGVLDSVAQNGGGVVNITAGEYRLESTIKIPSNVVLRGSGDDVKLQGYMSSPQKSRDDALIVFDGDTSKSGLEDLSITYAKPDFKPVNQSYKNDPNGQSDLHVTSVQMNGSQNWLKGVTIKDSGSHALKIEGDNNTIANSTIDGAYNKGTNGAGYFNVSCSQNLIIGNDIRNLRHFSIQGGGKLNLVVNNAIAVDVNFHQKDMGDNVVAYNKLDRPDGHPWQHISTGSPKYGHKKPGPNNLFFSNELTGKIGKNGANMQPGKVYTLTGYGAESLKETNVAMTKTTIQI